MFTFPRLAPLRGYAAQLRVELRWTGQTGASAPTRTYSSPELMFGTGDWVSRDFVVGLSHEGADFKVIAGYGPARPHSRLDYNKISLVPDLT